MTHHSNDRSSCDQVGRPCQTPARPDDGTGPYGFAIWGLWISFGWLLSHEHAEAMQIDPAPDSSLVHGQDVPLQPDMQRADAVSTLRSTGQLHGNEVVEPTSGMSVSSIAEMPREAGFVPTNAQTTTSSGENLALDGVRENDATSYAAETSLGPTSSQVAVKPVVSGPASLQLEAPQASAHPAVVDVTAVPQIHQYLDSETLVPGPLWRASETAAERNVTVIAGDYYDVQISFDFGSFGAIGAPVEGADLSLGSVLYSPASEYDLIVINQDLVELNVIVQQNIGTGSISNSSAQSQANEAAIVSFLDTNTHQVTLGDFINVTAVQQFNYLAGGSHSFQYNDAAILDFATGIDLTNSLSIQTFGYGADQFGLTPNDDTGQDYSALFVTGTYYEINLILQISVAALEDSGHPQFNHAVIYDFEDVALHQFVGGDEYDVDAILQANYLSELDQTIASPIDELIAQANAAAVFSGSAAYKFAPAGNAVAPGIVGPTAVPMQTMSMQSGELVGDLMA